MVRLFKTFLLVGAIAAAGSSASAFSLLGPNTDTAVSWQVQRIGYNLPINSLTGSADIGGPMNLGEEFRWNVPNLFYAFDSSFLNYFGSNGLYAVEQAIAVMNALPSASSLPQDLLDPGTGLDLFPLDTRRVNFQAQALRLLDLKSVALQTLVEEIGLAAPERYAWTIRDLSVFGANPPTTNYTVVQRNFDPVTVAPSAYVNGVLLTYEIIDPAVLINNAPVADAVESRADQVEFLPTSVAANSIRVGQFYTGLTRDDVGGYRYLYSTNNINVETLTGNSQVASTNFNSPEVLQTQDLGLLTERSAGTTLTATNILTLYPGIIIGSVTTRLTNVPAISFIGPTPVTNQVFITVFDYTYANTVTNFVTNQTWVTYRIAEVVPNPLIGPNYPLLATNVLSDPPLTAGGTVAVAARALITPGGLNNNFALTNSTAGTAFNGVRITFLDDGSVVGNAATATYDALAKVLTVRIQKDVSTAAAVVAAINAQGQFKAGLHLPSETGGNNGTGTLGANVSVTVLELRVGGEFYIVPAGVFGYHFTPYAITNFTTNITAVVTNYTAAFTNTSPGSLTNIITVDLNQFLQYASTNDPQQLIAGFFANFPNAAALPEILSATPYFTNEVVQTITAFFTNSPYTPATLTGGFVTVTNFTTNVVQRYNYTFGNIVTNSFATTAALQMVQTTYVRDPYTPATLTNVFAQVTTTILITNQPTGSIYFVPTNLFGYSIISTQLVQTVPYSNVIYSVVGTNNGFQVTNSLVQVGFATNYYLNVAPIEFQNPTNPPTTLGVRQERLTVAQLVQYAVYPIDFVTVNSNGVARRGVDKLTFIRVEFDSLIGASFVTVTNYYSNAVSVANGSNFTQIIRRVVAAPDILFRAADLGQDLTGFPFGWVRTDTGNWIENDGINGNAALAGPGQIAGQVILTFNKVGPHIVNQAPSFLNETTRLLGDYVWGSFDGSTNAPVIYPSGVTLQQLEQLILNGP